MRLGWVEGGGVTDENGGVQEKGGSGPPDPPPPLDTPMHALIPLGLGYEIKGKKCVMYKNLKKPAIICLENGNYNVITCMF